MKQLRPRTKINARAGFSLLEAMLGMTVLVVAIVGTMGSLSTSLELTQSNRETIIATQALRRQAERMSGTALASVYRTFNDTTADDLTPSAPGAHFDIPELTVQLGDADGSVGHITFPTANATQATLFENYSNADWGFPRDLSGDGTVSTTDVAGSYILLPVRLRAEWRGSAGDRVIEVETIMGIR